jgi:hypothetical protein
MPGDDFRRLKITRRIKAALLRDAKSEILNEPDM